MTSEERFIKIENALQAVSEMQARHEGELDKQNAGIRDLIVESRTLLDTANTHTGQLTELATAQKRTDEKMNALIDTVRAHEGKIEALVDIVDRIIRRENLS